MLQQLCVDLLSSLRSACSPFIAASAAASVWVNSCSCQNLRPSAQHSPKVQLLIWSRELFLLPSPPSNFLMLFQLQTLRGRGNLSQHTACEFLFHLLPASFRLSDRVPSLPRTLSNFNLFYWHNREETCFAEGKYISCNPIFSYFSLLSLPASWSLHTPLCYNPNLRSASLLLPLPPSIFLQHSCLDLPLPCLLSIIFFSLHHSNFSQFVLHFGRLADSLAKRLFLSSSSSSPSLIHMSLPTSHLFLNIFCCSLIICPFWRKIWVQWPQASLDHTVRTDHRL